MSKSFLEIHPGFENIELNKKGSINIKTLLKNGSRFDNKPLFVPGHDKVLLSNIYSAESLLSVLAVAMAESKHYRQFLPNIINKTTKFVSEMIGNRFTKEIYKNRIYLMVLNFINRKKQLIRYIILFDKENTAASTCQQLSSFQRFDCFKNNLCFNQERKYIGTIIFFLAIDGILN